MHRPRLFLSRDVELDWLSAHEFGVVDDGRPSEHWLGVSEQVGILLGSQWGPPIGFTALRFSELELDSEEHEELWEGPRFDVPVLGLRNVAPAEICVAADSYLDGEPTINRVYFNAAIGADEPEEALSCWRMCLETGDLMAHYGAGYTLLELGRYRESYRHLRIYTEIAPESAWAWCWLGYTCTAMDELGEARLAYARAVELEEHGGEETDAAEWLERLDGATR